MNFKYSAFIENTPEMREWLEELGYKMVYNHTYGTSILFVNSGLIYETNPGYPSYNLMIKEDHIDCRSNPQLFKAITAVREDSDCMQWFVCVESYKQDTESFGSCPGHNYKIIEKGSLYLNDLLNNMVSSKYRKATKDELIERFKTESK